MGINIRPWVLDLASFHEDWWHNLIYLRNKLENTENIVRKCVKEETKKNILTNSQNYLTHLEKWVIRQVLQSKFPLTCVARIGLAEHSMTISRYNLTALQCFPDELLDLLISGVQANSFLYFVQPYQYLQRQKK